MRVSILLSCALMFGSSAVLVAGAEPTNFRKPASDHELQYWLTNMVQYHNFTEAEVTKATGLQECEIRAAVQRFQIRREAPKRRNDVPMLVMPYPGGRHPRIGFLDGAIRPQRETKVSVFTPWSQPDKPDYVVVDVPEAIWSNLGLTYLAHTHVPTVWTKQGIELERKEWNRRKDGTFDIQRRLPNGIEFGAKIIPKRDAVHMKLSLKNGTKRKLSDLRVQNCVMLKAADGFNQQTKENKVLQKPYTACRSTDGKRWIITAWDPCHRPWANDRCPCLHSDPKFPDCEPGDTKQLKGWLSFYEGDDIQAEFERIEKTGWRRRSTQQ